MASVAPRPRQGPDPDQLVEGILVGNRALLGRAITLVESRNSEHQQIAQAMLARLLPHTGRAERVGITGVPGAGKSTFIEAMGCKLVEEGHKVAVLAVDPTSSRSGGSILADKTRMERLSVSPNAFIRPSPSAGTLGGVTRATRETMAVVEAAGFDVILVETVGVGQSETMVADMVDFFLVILIAGAGDEYQGIKKGVLELADMIAVNKADGNNVNNAKLAAAEYTRALHILKPLSPNWSPPALTCSAVTGDGLGEIWGKIQEHRETLSGSGELQERRRRQQVRWMWQMLDDRLLTAFRHHPEVQQRLDKLQREVAGGRTTATTAADQLLAAFGVNGTAREL